MMKNVRSAFALFAFLWLPNLSINAQVYGNSFFNWSRSNSNQNHKPVTHTKIPNFTETTLQVNGLINITADAYVAMFNVIQVGETVEITHQLMNDRISLLKKELKVFLVDTSSIKTDMISFLPKYSIEVESKLFSKTYNEVPSGFILQKNITVICLNSQKLNDITTAAAKAEIYDLVKVDYFVNDVQKHYSIIREKCIQNLRAKIASFASIGINLDSFNKAVTDDYRAVFPPTRYFNYTAFCRTSLEAAKKKSILGSGKISETEKLNSTYYKPLDYDEYDLVINPVITEPVVQLSYTLTVKYIPKPEKAKTTEVVKKEYIMVLPGGELKTLKIN